MSTTITQTEIQQEAGLTLVRIGNARFGADIAPAIKAELTACLQGSATRLVVDLTQVTFIDSSGLGALVSVFKLAGGKQHMGCFGLQPAVLSLFRLTRMDAVIPMYGSEAQALAAFAGSN